MNYKNAQELSNFFSSLFIFYVGILFIVDSLEIKIGKQLTSLEDDKKVLFFLVLMPLIFSAINIILRIRQWKWDRSVISNILTTIGFGVILFLVITKQTYFS